MKRSYPCIEADLSKIRHNTATILEICQRLGIDVVGVTKVFCAQKPIVNSMIEGGLKVIGDSRISNLRKVIDAKCEKLLLRIPMESNASSVVKYADISLNSEIETVKKISRAAKRAHKTHKIILMIDLGDLREGVLEYDVLDTAKEIIKLENIELIGVGTNLTCYGGVLPDETNLNKLIEIKEKLERVLEIKLPVISGGNSSSLYMVLDDSMPKGINQLRLGESIVLGRETAYGNEVPNAHKDCFVLKGEIIEIKNKPSIPTGKIGLDAFGEVPKFEDRGVIKRAIIALGRQDIKVDGITPLDSKIQVLGASSDHLILDVTESKYDYRVGDVVDFYMDYGCLLQAMTSPYVSKYYVG
jgi:ornithine racemase